MLGAMNLNIIEELEPVVTRRLITQNMHLYKQGKESQSHAVVNSLILEGQSRKQRDNNAIKYQSWKQRIPNICIVNLFFLQAVGKKFEYYAAQVSMLVCIRGSSSPTGYFHREVSLFSLVFSGKCNWVKINHRNLYTRCFKPTIHNNRAVQA